MYCPSQCLWPWHSIVRLTYVSVPSTRGLSVTVIGSVVVGVAVDVAVGVAVEVGVGVGVVGGVGVGR